MNGCQRTDLGSFQPSSKGLLNDQRGVVTTGRLSNWTHLTFEYLGVGLLSSGHCLLLYFTREASSLQQTHIESSLVAQARAGGKKEVKLSAKNVL